MINFSSWSIRNPVPTALFFILSTIIGFFCFKLVKIRNMPDVNLPMVVITVIYPGASPTILETDVVNKLENQLSSVPGLKHIYTTIVDGVATLIIEFPIKKNVQEALEDVRSTVSAVRSKFPPDVREPIINKLNISSQTTLAYAVSSKKRNNIELSELIDDVIRNRLSAIPEVGNLSLIGDVRREIRVDLNPVAMQALGITATQVSRQLKLAYSNNVAGKAIIANKEQQIRVIAKLTSPQEIAHLEIPLSNSRKVRLNEIANIYDTVSERSTVAFLDGKAIIGLELSQTKDTDQIQFSNKVEQELTQIKKDYPDLQFKKAFDFVEIAKEEYHSSLRLMLEGTILTILIVWLFLKSTRATLISALAMPLSVLPAFIGMYYFNFTINIVSLLAISLVIGVLVDDAIVEVENISRHLCMGKTPYQASMDATNEIGLAVIATTFTIIAVFLPTAFMSGIGGLFFRQFGLTASIAVFSSLVVARMLTPMLAAYLLNPEHHNYQEPKWLPQYMRISRWCLLNRRKTLIGAILFFIVSLLLLSLLPINFIPTDDNTHTQVTLEMPPGTRLNEMVSLVHLTENKLANIPYFDTIYSTIGAGSVGGDLLSQGSYNQAVITIRLKERKQRPNKTQIQKMIAEQIADLPGARATIGLGSSNDKYKLFLVSYDKEKLQKIANKLEQELYKIPGINGIQTSANLQRSEVAVDINFERAADLGVTANDIAETLKIATVGDIEEYLAKYDLGKRQIPILVKFNDEIRTHLNMLKNLYIPGTNGLVSLGEVANLYLTSGPVTVNHLDSLNSINFTISIGSLSMGEIQKQIYHLPTIKNLPNSVKIRELGDAEATKELFESFFMAIFLGGILVYAVLVLLFKNFLQPFTILIALPLATGGSLVAMLITGQSFSMSSLIGFIMLMGIVTKNSILLIEYAIVAYHEHGMSRNEAILDACYKRARPIIMTSLAMSFGMLPIALGWGNSDMSFRTPMAITIIGGLISSTILSLLIVPAFFTYMDDFENWLKKKFSTMRQSKSKKTIF